MHKAMELTLSFITFKTFFIYKGTKQNFFGNFLNALRKNKCLLIINGLLHISPCL